MATTRQLLEREEEEDESGVPASLLQNLLVTDSTTQQQETSEPLAKIVLPQPGFCVKTKTDKGEKVFVNICWSEQVPSPKDITDDQLRTLLESGDPTQFRVPLSLGEPHTEKDNVGKECSVYDVIISSQFYERIQRRPFMKDFLLTVVLEGLEDKYNILLCRECKIMKNRKLMGHIPEQTVRQKPKPFIIEVDSREQQATPPGNKKQLVTEITEGESKSQAPAPHYTIVREPVEGELPEFLVMEVQLPSVGSSKQLVLEVGEDRMLLLAHPCLYHLALDLPFLVNNEEVGAQFNMDSKVLSVTLPVTGTAPL